MKRSVTAGIIVAVLLVACGVIWRTCGGSSSDDSSQATDRAGGAGTTAGPRGRPGQRAKATPASVSGRVTRASDGAGIANAVVSLASMDLGAMFRQVDTPPLIAITDASGAWTAPQVPGGTYVVAANAAGFVPNRLPKLVVIAGEQHDGIDLALDAGGTVVSGTISDVGGGPIDGAQVGFRRSDAMPFASGGELRAVAGSDGRYQITLADGAYDARASHDDYTSAQQSFELAGKPIEIDFVLTPGSVIRGRVITRDDGKPVPGAHVQASGGRNRMGGRSASASADDEGNFTLRSLSPGALSLTARGRGYASAAPTVVNLGIGEQVDGIVIIVDRAFSISGRIVKKGTPTEGIPGAQVGVFSMTTGGQATTLEASADDGSYEIVGVRPASYVLFAMVEGHMPEMGKPVEVVDRDMRDIDIELASGATLAGRVEPAAVASIGLELATGGIGLGNMFEAVKVMMVRGESDATGAFVLRNVPNGSFSIRARTSGGRAGKLAVKVADEDQQGLVISLEQLASVSGRVLDARGAAVAGVRVKVTPVTKPEMAMIQMSPGGRESAVTAADGSFRVLGLEAGKVTVSVLDDQGPLAWAHPAASAEPNDPIELELAKCVERSGTTLTVEARDGVIRGLVLGADRKPAADAWVTARVIAPKASDLDRMMSELGRGSVRPVLTGADGTFAIDRLRRGTYKLVVEGDKGRARGEASGVKTGGTVTITLESLGSLTGRVTAGSAPVTTYDLHCDVAKRALAAGFGGTRRRVTSRDGSYALDRLVPGTYECEATADAGAAKGTVEIPAGPATLDLALQPWASVTGVVVSVLSGQPVAGVQVMQADMNARTMGSVLTGRAPTTDATGRFVVDQLEPGTGQISVLPAKGSFASLARKEYTVAAGQRVDLGTIEIVPPRTGELGTLGMTTAVAGDKLTVSFVQAGGPAEAAGIQVGDAIISIEGRPVAELTAEIGRKLLASGTVSAGQAVQLGLDRAGSRLQLRVVAAAWE